MLSLSWDANQWGNIWIFKKKSQYQYLMNWIQTFHKRTELEALMALLPF
jgi:hypothetical protein